MVGGETFAVNDHRTESTGPGKCSDHGEDRGGDVEQNRSRFSASRP